MPTNYKAPCASCKQKYARSNHLPFMNKTVSKEVMKTTRTGKKCMRKRTEHNKKLHRNRETIASLCLESINGNITAVLTKKISPTKKVFGKL